MSIAKKIRLLLLYVFPAVWCSGADQESWRAAYNGAAFHDRQELLEAERLLLAVLDHAAGPNSDDKRAANVLNNLGVVYHQLGRYAQSEYYLKRAIGMWRRTLGDDAVLTGHGLGNLAALYVEMGSYAKIERLNLGGLTARWETSHSNSPDLAQLLTCLGAVAIARGNRSEAERLQKQALTIVEKLAPDSLAAGRIHNNLGTFYLETGRNVEALVSLKRSLEISETNSVADRSTQTPILFNLAQAEHAVHGPSEAEPFYKRALAIAELSLDPHHPLRANILSHYARALREMKRKGEAKECEHRAKSILEAAARVNPGQHTVDVRDLLSRTAKH
jgi:tetratricopeptide (TPR) repeat protein